MEYISQLFLFEFTAEKNIISCFREPDQAEQYFQQYFVKLPNHALLMSQFEAGHFYTILEDAKRLFYKWTFDGISILVAQHTNRQNQAIRPSKEITDLHRSYAFCADRLREYQCESYRQLFNAYIGEVTMIRSNMQKFDAHAPATSILFRIVRPDFMDRISIEQQLRRMEVLILMYYTQTMEQFFVMNQLQCHKGWSIQHPQQSADFPNSILHVKLIASDSEAPDESKKKERPGKPQLIIWLLYQFQINHYAYIGDVVYTPKLTPSGIHMRAWTRYKPIVDCIWELADKERHYEMWTIVVNLGEQGVVNLASTLMAMNDWQFPRLVRQRNLYTFRNGLYITNLHKVLHLPEELDPVDGHPIIRDQFFPYDSLPDIDHRFMSTKHFDIDFIPFTDLQLEPRGWYSYATPAFQSILDYQYRHLGDEVCEDVCRMMYVMVGRLLHGAGELDNWQVWPYVKGCAGTGKSTIITKVCKEFFEPDDVGILASTSEKLFGVSAFIDKKLVIAPEMGKCCDFPQTTLQSMISAEDVNCAQKFKTAEMRKFVVPGICAGNENMGQYRDVGGSLARRWFWFLFEKKIPPSQLDMTLGSRLAKELPMILAKCNHAYLEFVNQHYKDDLFAVCPQYFVERRAEFSADNSPIVKFLNSDYIVKDADSFVPLTVIQRQFGIFCSTELRVPNNSIHFEVESFQTALAELAENDGAVYTFERTLKKRMTYAGASTVDYFVYGIDVIAKKPSFAQ
jgi:hypothetical protein